MRVQITIPDAQFTEITRTGERLGVPFNDALRYLITRALEQSLVAGSVQDQGDFLQWMKSQAIESGGLFEASPKSKGRAKPKGLPRSGA